MEDDFCSLSIGLVGKKKFQQAFSFFLFIQPNKVSFLQYTVRTACYVALSIHLEAIFYWLNTHFSSLCLSVGRLSLSKASESTTVIVSILSAPFYATILATHFLPSFPPLRADETERHFLWTPFVLSSFFSVPSFFCQIEENE